jgi:hypothetical protein
VLSADDLAALVACGAPRSFPRGQALFHVGQVPDRVLPLRSGRVKVETTTAGGRSVVLAVRGPGELAALDEQPRSASIVALEPVDAIAFSHRDYGRPARGADRGAGAAARAQRPPARRGRQAHRVRGGRDARARRLASWSCG